VTRLKVPSEIRDSIQIMPESDYRVGPTEHLFYTRVPARQAKFGSAISEPCRAEQSQGIRTISYPHNRKGGTVRKKSWVSTFKVWFKMGHFSANIVPHVVTMI